MAGFGGIWCIWPQSKCKLLFYIKTDRAGLGTFLFGWCSPVWGTRKKIQFLFCSVGFYENPTLCSCVLYAHNEPQNRVSSVYHKTLCSQESLFGGFCSIWRTWPRALISISQYFSSVLPKSSAFNWMLSLKPLSTSWKKFLAGVYFRGLISFFYLTLLFPSILDMMILEHPCWEAGQQVAFPILR